MSSALPLEQRIRRLEDIVEIKTLKGLYCKYNDGGWPEQGPSHRGPCLELFVEDAVWDGRPYFFHAEGREAIGEALSSARSMPFVVHNVMTPIIEVNGDVASGHWHMICCVSLPDFSSHWLIGHYLEDYVRTAQGWRFKAIRLPSAALFPQPAGWTSGAPFDTVGAGRLMTATSMPALAAC